MSQTTTPEGDAVQPALQPAVSTAVSPAVSPALRQAVAPTAAAGRPATVAELLAEVVERDPGAVAVSIPDSFGGWFDLTVAELADRVEALAKGFLAAGLDVGDRVAVLCSLRYEATLIDLAAALVGVAVVPLDGADDQSALHAVLDDSRARGVVVETVREFARVDEIQGDLPLVGDVWQLALGGLDKLVAAGRAIDDASLRARMASVDGGVAMTVYSRAGAGLGSGSDAGAGSGDGSGDDSGGSPRAWAAVEQRVAVGRAIALATRLGVTVDEQASTLVVLPPTDVDSRLLVLTALAGGLRFGHLADPARLIDALASFRPSLLVARPESFESIDAAAHERAAAGGRGSALRQAVEVGLEWSQALDSGLSRGLKTRYALADTLIFRGLRKSVGNRLRTAIVLADERPLADRLRHLMRALDVRPLEAFGTLETSGIAVIESPADPFTRPPGGVGAPLDGVAAAVVDGTLRLRGPGIRAMTFSAPAASDGAAADAGGVAIVPTEAVVAALTTETVGASKASPASESGAGSGSPEWLDLDLEAGLDDSGRVQLLDREPGEADDADAAASPAVPERASASVAGAASDA